MADHQVRVHEIEYLAVLTGKIDDEPVVIMTIRPDLPSSFRPHNLGIPRSQAERLWEDLKAVLSRSAVWAVRVDLLQDRGPVLMENERPVDVPRDGVLVVEGCVHFHEHLRRGVVSNRLTRSASWRLAAFGPQRQGALPPVD